MKFQNKIKKMNSNYLSIFLIISVLFFSCKNEEKQLQVVETKDFVVQNFEVLTNWQTSVNETDESGKTFERKYIELDYNNAIDSGFVIPSVTQTEDGLFHFSFEVKNKTAQNQKFRFKIYYQNQTYKFPEFDEQNKEIQNKFAWENFYGSNENTEIGFLETEEIPADSNFHAVTASLRIVGNPRNELRYFYNQTNDRWKRNPRMGNYAFLLTVTTSKVIEDSIIPPYVQNISILHDSTFVNPFFYFLYGKGKSAENTAVVLSEKELKVVAKPELGNGIYIEKGKFMNQSPDFESYYTEGCGNDSLLRLNAPFEQFIHYIDTSVKLYNIPLIQDVLGNYSKTDYNWNARFTDFNERIGIYPKTATIPCEIVYSDPVENMIVIKNPKSEFGNWQKHSVGIISRHGFTFGKHTVKVKLTELLNDSNVWNGITNAIWMINQGGRGQGWNNRRTCENTGYMATYWGGANDARAPQIDYSEIDFEILKTVHYCPPYTFPPVFDEAIPNRYNVEAWNSKLPEELLNEDADIVVACTNWDMACPQPEFFNSGCNAVVYNDTSFEAHRWEKTYRALTQKIAQNDDELFGSDYFYFQIDWRPTEIIWRIGASKENMRVVGYMDYTVTSIPNNQMLLIVTQEFHNTKWWIGSPYDQHNIPFPAKDYVGYIYEYTIE